MNFSLPPLTSLFASSLGTNASDATTPSDPPAVRQDILPQVQFGLYSDVFERSSAQANDEDSDPMAKRPIFYWGDDA
ncbi:MAG: hypothetical protein VKJ04_07860 [Vampirovibrionales bacterium]|nr:hypothetical protein [Vampirovibrionales bacterium]